MSLYEKVENENDFHFCNISKADAETKELREELLI